MAHCAEVELLRSRTGHIAISAHRGAKGYAPENTMAAFRRAAELGADSVELDVHLTADDHIVVIHDEALDRTTNGTGYVRDHTWDEIRALDAGSWFAPDFAGERVPLLAEVLAWAREAAMPLSIEIKRPTPAFGRPPYPDFPRRVLELVREHRLTDVLFHSDDHASVLEIKRLAPEFPTGIAHGGAMFIDPLAAVRAARADGLYTHWRYVTRELVDRCHAADVHVFGFGVGDDPTQLPQIHAMLENGTDFLSSAYPDRLRQVVTDWLASRP